MKIASWNCNNLNPRSKNKINRKDYLNSLRGKVPDLDVIFLMEVESVFSKTTLDQDFSFHCFFPCTELDKDWAPMTSGIFLAAAKHIEVEGIKEEAFFLPKKGNDPEYGFAFRTVLRDSNSREALDLVTFWNTRRKNPPRHDYAPTLKFLLKKLADTDFFNPKKRHMIIGDFNLEYQDIRKLIPVTETVLITEETFFKKKNPDENGSSLDHIICSKADADSIRFLGKDGQAVSSFKESLGFTERHTFVKQKFSDHLPLFVQF